MSKQKIKRAAIWTAVFLVLFAIYTAGISNNPPGLYVDESGLAYNAYLVSRTGGGEFGHKFPIFFQFFTAGYTQWCSPTQIYLLAITFLFLPPSVFVARMFSAFWVFTACILLGFLAKRISGKTSVGVIVGGAALLTPWFFEIRGVLMEPHFIPMALVLFLFLTYRAQTLAKWTWHQAATLAASLALLTYCYSSGRILAPLLAAGLVVFVTQERLKALLMTWLFYGLTLLPIFIFNWLNPGALTARFHAATYLKPDMPWMSAAWEFLSRYTADIGPACLLVNGDVVVRHHVPGFYGPFFYSIFLLAVIGLVIVLVRRITQRWWLFALFGLAIAPLPGAITFEPCHAMRQMALPVFLFVMTIPAVQWFLARNGSGDHNGGDHGDKEPKTEQGLPAFFPKRLAYVKPIVLGLILTLTVIEAIRFQYYYQDQGPRRHIYFDAGYKEAFDVAVAQPKRPIYLVDGDYGPTYITGLWYAAQERLPREEFVHVTPGTRPPGDVLVLTSERQCTNCQTIDRKGAFTVYVTDPQPDTGSFPGTAPPVFGGGEGSEISKLVKPRGIAADSDGNLYVADTGNGRIQKFSPDGELLGSIASDRPDSGELREPIGITLDGAGNIYVADGTTNRLSKFGPDLNFIKSWSGPDPGFYGLRDLAAVGPHIFILDQGRNRVVRLDTKTDTFHQWGSSGSGEGQFNELTGIAASDERVFIADARNDRVQVFDHEGNFVLQWPVPQWQEYIWHFPDIAFDKDSGRVYVTSGWSNELLVFDEAGVFIEAMRTDASLVLDNPSSLAIVKSGAARKLFIVNTGNIFAEPAQSGISMIGLPAVPAKTKTRKK